MRVNISTIVGHLLGWVCVISGVLLGRVGIGPYVSLSSIFITVGGATASLLIAAPSAFIKNARKIIRLSFMKISFDYLETIDLLVSLSDRARKDGLLALEDTLVDIPNEFLRKGLQMVVDGADPDIIKRTLNIQIEEMQSRHEQNVNTINFYGKIMPAFGLIGTVIGLVALLGNIGGEPAAIGRGMQTALITTLYGAVIANLLILPIGNRLSEMDIEEVRYYYIVLEGVAAIQSGDNPRILRDRLFFFLSREDRIGATFD